MVVVEEDGWAAAEDRRFFASATAPVAAGLTALVVVVGPVLDVPTADDRTAPVVALGEDVVEEEAGFLAAAVVAAVELLFTLVGEAVDAEELPLAAVEVLRRVLADDEVDVRFFSSSDTDGCERCVAVDVDPAAGRLVVVVVEPAAGRVGALLKPPVAAVRTVDPVAVLVIPVPAATGRRVVVPAVVATRFVAVELEGFASAVPLVDVEAAGAAEDSGAAGASKCWGASDDSTSAMVGKAVECQARQRSNRTWCLLSQKVVGS